MGDDSDSSVYMSPELLPLVGCQVIYSGRQTTIASAYKIPASEYQVSDLELVLRDSDEPLFAYWSCRHIYPLQLVGPPDPSSAMEEHEATLVGCLLKIVRPYGIGTFHEVIDARIVKSLFDGQPDLILTVNSKSGLQAQFKSHITYKLPGFVAIANANTNSTTFWLRKACQERWNFYLVG